MTGGGGRDTPPHTTGGGGGTPYPLGVRGVRCQPQTLGHIYIYACIYTRVYIYGHTSPLHSQSQLSINFGLAVVVEVAVVVVVASNRARHPSIHHTRHTSANNQKTIGETKKIKQTKDRATK
jgi:hypothetical protein